MKDKIKYGNKPFKKVIAQQVEEVYPQVVNKSINYIPNVYQLCNSIEKNKAGYLLTFNEPHNLSNDAKKLQLIDGRGIQQRYDIVSIPSDKQVLLNATSLTGDTVFVFGEQVNDFRSVDYEGLTTLNISATQELSKQVAAQQATIKEQNEKITTLSTKVQIMIDEIEKLKHK
jgi:trimeric autotransporter adhesin